MTRGRTWRALAALGAILVLGLGGAAYWLLATQSGLSWSVNMARHYAPVALEVERAEGRLIGPIELSGVRVRDEAVTVRVERLRLDWQPAALLGGVVDVERLWVDGVEVETPRAAARAVPEAEPAQLALPTEWTPPLAIRVDRLRLTRLRLLRPDAPALEVERIALGLRVDPSGGRVDDLRIEAPAGRVRGHLALGARAPFALDGHLTWRYAPAMAELAPMAGDAELAGSLAGPHVRVRTETPSRVTVSASARPFDAGLPWTASVIVAPTRARAWSGVAPALTGDARLSLAGTLERARGHGEVALAGLPTGPVHARLELTATAARIQLERLEMRLARRPGARLGARGSVELTGQAPVFDVDARWRDLAWPLEGDPRVTSTEGQLHLQGRPEAYRFEGRASVRPRAGEAEPARLEVAGRGTRSGLPSWSLSGEWRGARLAAEGGLRWTAPGHARARLALEGLDPAQWAAVAPGELSADLALQASWGERWQVRADMRELTGAVGGQAVTGSGRVSVRPDGWRVAGLTVRAGAARLEADGGGGERLDLGWRVSVPDIGALVRGLRGRLEGEGRLRGTLAEPRAEVQLAAQGIEGRQWRVDTAEIAGVIAPLGGADTDVRARVSGVAAGGVRLGRVAATLTGTPARHRLQLSLEAEAAAAEATVVGAIEPDGWAGALTEARVQRPQEPAWRLQTRQPVRWVAGTLTLERGCWARGDASVCLNGRAGGSGWAADLEARAVPLAAVGDAWRSDLDYTGRLDLTARFAAAGGPITGRVRLATTAGHIAATVDERSTKLLAFRPATVTLELAPERVDVIWDVPLDDGGRLDGELALGRSPTRSLDGRVGVRVQQLGLLPQLVPQIGSIEGRLVGEAELSGSLAQPTVGGDLRLDAGSLTVAPLGIRLTDVEGGLATAQAGLGVRLRASSGSGRVELAARAMRAADGAWRGEGSLVGAEFTAVDVPQLRARVSPYLEWRVDGRTVEVTGSVRVPSALIAPRDLAGAQRPSPDAVIMDTTEPEPPAPAAESEGWRVRADVAVVPGADVRVDAFGLEARLTGSMRVIERPQQVTTATGELKVVEGTYSIYRQTLTIERGRVLFGGGPVANPGLDVRAVRRPRDVVVGVNVRGTLREPRVELFSEPPMAESQVLSYLIVGLPLGETSAGQSETVAAAASALLSTKEAGELAQALGVDELTVEQNRGDEGTSVVLGRYLSPRLYVGYGVGLLEQANSVRLRYQLSEHWSFEGRSGTTSGADVLYSIEVDESAQAVPQPLRDAAGAGGASAPPAEAGQ